MNKKILFFCMCMLLCVSLFTACAEKDTEIETETQISVPEEETETDLATEAEATETEEEQTPEVSVTGIVMPFEGQKEFWFSSGAGGWYTEMTVTEDGLFQGHYQDSDMGSGGDGYKGTYYFCDFIGNFESIEKIDDYSYRLTLGDLTVTNEKTEEWIENETLHVPSAPYGMENCKTFYLYMPGTNVTQFPEDFLSWWNTGRNDDGSLKPILDSYAIHNPEEGTAFFCAE